MGRKQIGNTRGSRLLPLFSLLFSQSPSLGKVQPPSLCFILFALLSLWQARPHSLPSYTRVRYLFFKTHPSFVAMGENWFQREFLTPRRLVFNVLFYGSQIFWFVLGWYLQVRLDVISLRRVLLTASLL